MATRKRLSPHFTVEEFDCHNGQKVKSRDYDGLEYLCKTYLEPIRKKYGRVTVNSGYRPTAYNASIGGASKSYHNYDIHDGNDQACDITCAKGGPRDWHRTANWIRQNKRSGKGGLGLYPRFIHIDIRDYPSSWSG